MKLKMSVILLSSFLLFHLQANALGAINSTDSAGLLMLKKETKETFRERKQETREQVQTKRDELKQRLLTLRDQKKRAVIERIDTRMANANKKTTTRLSSVLEKIQAILNKIIDKAGLAKTKGLNTTALDSATASAQLSINNANAIVASQSAMVYVIQIASESAAKENVGSTVSELRADLRDAHKAVIDAKQAVHKAAMELSKLNGSGIFKDNRATNSAQ